MSTSNPVISPPSSLWRSRDFVLLWTGQNLSVLGSQISSFASPLLVLTMTHSPLQVGLVAATSTSTRIIVTLPAGFLVDRWDRKLILIVCDAVRLMTVLSIPIAYVAGDLTLGQLYGVAIIVTAASTVFGNAELSALPAVAGQEQFAQAISINAVADSIIIPIGSAVGGTVMSLARTIVAGASLTYLVDSLSFLFSIATLSGIQTPFQSGAGKERSISAREEVTSGLRFVIRDPVLRTLTLVGAATALVGAPSFVAVLVLARVDLHMTPFDIGLIATAGGISGILGTLLAPRIQAHARIGHVIVASLAVQALGTLVLAIGASVPALVLGQAITASFGFIMGMTALTVRLARTPNALQGRVNSILELLPSIMSLIGLSVGGALVQSIGPRAVLALTASCLAAITLASAFTGLRDV